MGLRQTSMIFLGIACIAVALAGYAQQSRMGSTPQSGQKIDFSGPKTVKASYQKLFNTMWDHYGGSDDVPLANAKLQFQELDLNKDGVPELVFKFESGMYCNYYGCPTYIARKPYTEKDIIFHSFSSGVEILTERIDGYPSLLDQNVEDVTYVYDRSVEAYIASSIPKVAR